MQFKKFKSLASTLMKKNLIVTITVVTAISLGILTGCGAYQQASADPLTNPTQIEQMVEDEHQETEASGDVSEKETQETTQEATETSSEQAERQNQDADHTEQSHNDSKPSTETTESKPSTEQAHVHTWVTETRYKIVHHDAKKNTVHHDSQTHVVHHDAVTHQETQTTYTTEYETVHHDGNYVCRGCGATFTSEADANAHCMSNSVECAMGGWSGTAGWDEEVPVQVPHTETVTIVDQAAWDETVVDKAAWDETVVDHEAYDEQVPYTVTVCSECGKEK